MGERTARQVENEREPARAADSDDVSDAISAREAADILAVHERTVRRAIARGELAAVRCGRSFCITLAALEDYRVRSGRAVSTRAGPRRADAAADAARSAPAAVAPTGGSRFQRRALPSPLTRFVGRAEDLATLAQLLRSDEARLVTVTGPGGVGKTRLALRAAEEAAPVFSDGVTFVPLATLRDPTFVPFAIVHALGLHGDGSTPPAAHLESSLRDARMLLVLDNFERIVAAGPALAAVLAACPGVVALVTSRVRLNVSGEHLVVVDPLALPRRFGSTSNAAPLPPMDELGKTESIQLFVDRAQAARPDFELTAENAAAVAAICVQADGLPLAIELAAARSSVLNPVALLARMDQRLPLLTGGPSDLSDRQRTMRDAIAWSDALLDPATRAHFHQLAVFRGGFGLDAAEWVAARATPASDGDRTPPDGHLSAIDALDNLLTGSLLQRSGLPDDEPRFIMLETVREYAREQLAAAGEEPAARTAHAAFFHEFVTRAQTELWAAADEPLLDRIELERENLRAALEWTTVHDPATALRLAGGLGLFWSKRGYWSEARMWLERALAADAGSDSAARATALGRLGATACDLSDGDAALRFLNESLAMANRLGAVAIAARALRGLGILASDRSDFAEATALFGQALERFRALDDRPGIARSLNDLGLVADRQGDHAAAIAFQEEALPIARALGDDWQVCIILGNLGGAYVDRGEPARGAMLTEEALDLARRLGDEFGVAVNLHNLANVTAEMGDVAAAVPLYREALTRSLDLGEQHLATRTLERLAALLRQSGSARAAVRFFGAADAVRAVAGDPPFAEEAVRLTSDLQALRDDLGDDVFAAAWDNGRSLPFAQAVADAIALTVAVPGIPPSEPPQGDGGLTARELEVLRLLVNGKADRQIARALFVARPTASKHVAAIIAKLGVDSRTAAVAVALRRGLV
ncbi:MAG: tetratricopeptide repeat protein [Thermomicrobiales bacterium]|nr:tetratricopeptide repeat protein [Thermomicrobiales bacterium]